MRQHSDLNDNETIDQVVEQLKQCLEENCIALNVTLENKEASVVSSNQYLRKILMNLYKCILKRCKIPLNKNMIASWDVEKKGI